MLKVITTTLMMFSRVMCSVYLVFPGNTLFGCSYKIALESELEPSLKVGKCFLCWNCHRVTSGIGWMSLRFHMSPSAFSSHFNFLSGTDLL